MPMNRKYSGYVITVAILTAVIVLGLTPIIVPTSAEFSSGTRNYIPLKSVVNRTLTVHVSPPNHGNDMDFKVKIYMHKYNPITGDHTVYVDTTDGTWTGSFKNGTAITLCALGGRGSGRWAGWAGDLNNVGYFSEPACPHGLNLILSGDKDITAYYYWQVDVSPLSYYGGSIDLSPSNDIYLSPSNICYSDEYLHCYRDGTSVTATAIANPGYRFDHWELDGSDVSEDASMTWTIHRDYTLTAVFVKTYTLTIQVSPSGGGTTSPAAGTYTYDEGQTVQVTATPNSGYRFDHWELDGRNVSTSSSYSVTMKSGHTLKAVFVKTRTLTIKVEPFSGGTTDPSPGSHTEDYGDSISVTAIANPGYRFDHWELDGSDVGSDNPYTVTMKSGHTLKAVFVKTQNITTYVTDGSSHLSGVNPITLNPADNNGNSQGEDGSTFTYDYYAIVRLGADHEIVVDGKHYAFDHWADSCSGTYCSPIMGSDKTVTAVYTLITHTLTVQVRDPDNNVLSCQVNVNPPNTNVGDGLSNTYNYDDNNPVALAAQSCSGYRFDHWKVGGTTSTNNPYSFIMNSDKAATAVYVKQVKITHIYVKDDQDNDLAINPSLTFTPPTSGTTYNILNPPTPSNGQYGDSDCPFTMDVGTQVTAQAHSLAGYEFDHWELGSAPSISTSNSYTFIMNKDHSLKAVYWKQVSLSLTAEDELGTSIGCAVHLDFTAPSSAYNNPPEPDGNYAGGSTIMVYRSTDVAPTALSCSGYRFDHWELDGSSWTGSFSMSSDRSLKAVFWKQYTLTVEVDGSGTTNPYHLGTYNLDKGTSFHLSPVAYAVYQFDHWTVDGKDISSPSSNTISVTMNRDHHVVAHFTKSSEALAPTPLGALASTPSVPVAAPAYEGCTLPTSFPAGMKYKSMYIDIIFNEDLLAKLFGPGPFDTKNLFILGGPEVTPYPWEQYKVYFSLNTLNVESNIYTAEFAHKDYAAILLDCSKNIVRIAGVNRYGTRAGFMWSLNHPDKLGGKLLIVVEWVDSNWNQKVEDSEIRVVYSLP